LLLAIFRSRIVNEYELPGEVTIHRSKKEKGELIPGPKINDFKLTLTQGETIFVLYDDRVHVVPGGAGRGARVTGGRSVFAVGGRAGPGEMDERLNVKAGDGLGGSAYGVNVIGSGGEAYGGNAESFAPHTVVESGAAVGGDLVHKYANSVAHTFDKDGTSKKYSSSRRDKDA
jgi:hypothetical protein